MRYGRHYFRPVSADGFSFSVPDSAGGAVAYSRILANQEVVVAANTSTTMSVNVEVAIDDSLTQAGTSLAVAYSNNPGPQTPPPVHRIDSASVAEVDGSHSTGPLNAVTVTLAPMEIQILVSHPSRDARRIVERSGRTTVFVWRPPRIPVRAKLPSPGRR